MTESSSSSGSSGVNIYDDVYEPSEILVEHIGENDSEAAVCGSGDEDSSCGDAEVPTAATTTTTTTAAKERILSWECYHLIITFATITTNEYE
mmetsp:Transcript_26624/g.38037  ORF Transcript_26624/g.38037 Transcript_26624/m.38037 type:complete len:93 (+) Transcript_26624:73-351(+)